MGEREAICYNKVFMIDRRWERDAICYNKIFMIHELMSCDIEPQISYSETLSVELIGTHIRYSFFKNIITGE